MTAWKEISIAIVLVGFAAALGGCGWLFDTDVPEPAGGPGKAGHIPGVAKGGAMMDMNLDAIIPDKGPLPGSQRVRLEGTFPIAAPIASANAAYNAYGVYFGANRALFDPAAIPVATASRMYVLTPPGDRPGFVDVRVAEAMYNNDIAFRTDGYEYVGLKITDVVPDRGCFIGGEPVRLDGFFSIQDFENAHLSYTVTFGGNVADFDPDFSPPMTATAVYVISPPGPAGELVDVIIRDDADPPATDTFGDDGQDDDMDGEIDGFSYAAFETFFTSPDQGPLVGGNEVTLIGCYPVRSSIFDLATAEAAYTVYFDYNIAPFNAAVNPPDPIISATRMYVIAPPGDELGFVDVTVAAHIFGAADVYEATGVYESHTLINGYEYVGGGIGIWQESNLDFRPVGKIEANELEIEIVVTGSANDAFIVPQGGDPFNPNHRILLTEESRNRTGGVEVTTWSNTEPIDTVIFDTDSSGPDVPTAGDVFADGHAYVVLVDETGQFLGANFSDPSDLGRIVTPALEDRHFLIDTVPPRLVPGGQGRDHVTLLNTGDYTTNNVNVFPNFATPLSHPFNMPGGVRQSLFGAPDDDTVISDTPNTNTGAQIFFDVASISNRWEAGLGSGLPVDLNFQTVVEFLDLSVHEAFELTPGPNDIDRFDGSVTTRQVSGFASDETEPDPTELRDLQTDENHVVQWVYQSESSALPSDVFMLTLYETLSDTDTGFNLIPDTFPRMRATWELESGVEPDAVDLTFHISSKFRGADIAARAGDSDVEYTEFPARLDPLHMWWIREVRTDVNFNGVPGAETVAPGLNWQQVSAPQLQTFINPANPPLRQFNFRVYATEPGLPKDAAKDGPYTPLANWSGWSPATALSDQAFFSIVPAGQPANDRWYLFVVVGLDEPGNVEQWPGEDVAILDTTDPFFSDVAVTTSTDPQGVNWVRFFVPTPPVIVETRIAPTFWHETNANFVPDQFEANFGNANVVPLAPRGAVSELFGQFRITMETTLGAQLANAAVEWELLKEGQFLAGNTALPVATGGDTVIVTLPPAINEPLGDLVNRRPVNYTFRAATVAEDDSGTPRRDNTPANFQFVVVDNVARYIENREQDRAQPVLESESN